MEGTDYSIAMLPKKTAECDWTYYMPGGGKRGEMPCIRDLESTPRTTTTFWVPAETVPKVHLPEFGIRIVYWGMMDRRVFVGFGNTADSSLWERQLEPYPHADGAGWTGITLDDQMVDYLNSDDSYFIVRINSVPPPPVQIWIE